MEGDEAFSTAVVEGLWFGRTQDGDPDTGGERVHGGHAAERMWTAVPNQRPAKEGRVEYNIRAVVWTTMGI